MLFLFSPLGKYFGHNVFSVIYTYQFAKIQQHTYAKWILIKQTIKMAEKIERRCFKFSAFLSAVYQGACEFISFPIPKQKAFKMLPAVSSSIKTWLLQSKRTCHKLYLWYLWSSGFSCPSLFLCPQEGFSLARLRWSFSRVERNSQSSRSSKESTSMTTLWWALSWMGGSQKSLLVPLSKLTPTSRSTNTLATVSQTFTACALIFSIRRQKFEECMK